MKDKRKEEEGFGVIEEKEQNVSDDKKANREEEKEREFLVKY